MKRSFLIMFMIWGIVFFGIMIYGIYEEFDISVIAAYATTFNFVFVLLFALYLAKLSKDYEVRADAEGLYMSNQLEEREKFRVDYDQVEEIYWNVEGKDDFAVVFHLEGRGKKLKLFPKDKIDDEELLRDTVSMDCKISEEMISVEEIKKGM